MHVVRVDIVRFADDHQPGLVECHLKDVNDRIWTFVEKAPVVSSQSLDADSEYPTPGRIACAVLEEFFNANGRRVIVIDTEEPWGVAAEDGTTVFYVFAEQLQ